MEGRREVWLGDWARLNHRLRDMFDTENCDVQGKKYRDLSSELDGCQAMPSHMAFRLHVRYSGLHILETFDISLLHMF